MSKKEYLSSDFFGGFFIGGIIGMIIMALADIWNGMGYAPSIFALLCVAIAFIEKLVIKCQK